MTISSKATATGMCRSDYQLLNGYFEGPFPVDLPYIPGHEVTGRVAGLGAEVPATVGYSEGDMVVVNPSWGGRHVPAVPGGQRTAVQR
ncbi:alcohol dehydrogenase catalytic domain-containing protein [Streptomyces sp. PTD5-9]|uniref:alcohol dehydrogenase catalytic domain-containing protein n=1 Tax=Streptomyces sp. PTD5-9 TaxID=3120150 RepID=UPI00300AA245